MIGVPVRHRQLAARHEGGLNVNQTENVGVAIDLHVHSLFRTVLCRSRFLRSVGRNKKTREQI